MRNLLRTTAFAVVFIAGAVGAQQPTSPDNQQPQGTPNEAAQQRLQNTPGATGGDKQDAKGGSGNPAPAQSVGPPEAGNVPLRGNGMNVPGATAQTAPAKFSQENADLAEYSIMGYPLQLSGEQRQAIWQSLGAGESKETASAEGKTIFAEAGVFLPEGVQAQPLPEQLSSQMPELRGLKNVKTDD